MYVKMQLQGNGTISTVTYFSLCCMLAFAAIKDLHTDSGHLMDLMLLFPPGGHNTDGITHVSVASLLQTQQISSLQNTGRKMSCKLLHVTKQVAWLRRCTLSKRDTPYWDFKPRSAYLHTRSHDLFFVEIDGILVAKKMQWQDTMSGNTC